MKLLALALLLLPTTTRCDELRGIVISVHDGDTLTIQCGEEFHKIRLSGIDAPELRQAFGVEARAALAVMTAGKPVIVIFSKRDRYGRILGTVLAGSINVNLDQVLVGHAWYFARYARETPEIERIQYECAEKEAREAKVGLWIKVKPTPPWEWRRLKKRKRKE